MKMTIAILSLVVSANVFAYSLADSTALTTALPLVSSLASSGGLQKAEAAGILNDAQEYMQSGRVSAFLAQKITETQALHAGASEVEALDMLINDAEAILK